MSANGARDIAFTGLRSADALVEGTYKVGVHLNIPGVGINLWFKIDEWFNEDSELFTWNRENETSNPRITMDRVVEYEHNAQNSPTGTADPITIADARVVIGTQGVGVEDPFLVLIPAGSISGGPIELQEGQKLIFNNNQIKLQLSQGNF